MLEFIPQYMPWGSGIGSFVPIYQIHEPPTLLIPGYFNQAHNDWIDIALTSGIPGAVLALAALIMFALGAKSALAARGVAGHLRKCGIIVILVLAFASLSDYPLRTPILSALFAIAAVWAWSPETDNTHKRKPEAS
jgi:O-antigen ligase